MFIIKYALKSISRSIGRNILIAIIVVIIATAACVAMSIQHAAETAASNSLKGMNISAQVNVDRGYVLEKAKEIKGTDDMSVLMPEIMSLMKEHAIDLEKMEEYCEIKKGDSNEPLVKDHYYNASISINGEDIKKYDLTASTEETTAATEAPTEATTMVAPTMTDPAGNIVEVPTMPTAPTPETPQEQPQMEKPGDFSLIGYSGYKAMEDFSDDDEESICKMTEGEMFEDNTSEYVCVVEKNLADYNSIAVGDTIKLVNPNNEDETYELKVVGIYKCSTGSLSDGSDASNTILTSYAVVKDIESKSEVTNTGSSSSDSGGDSSSSTAAQTTTAPTATQATTAPAKAAATTSPAKAATTTVPATTAPATTVPATTGSAGSSGTTGSDSSDSSEDDSKVLVSQFTGAFVFGSLEDYNRFKEEVKNKAIEDGEDGDMYIVTSSDVANFKAGLKPLKNLKSFATTFLYLTLAIGAIVLIVISVISIRDRKYEIGVLAAMGMKKLKLSVMFMVEVLIITLVGILIGAAAGSAASVPVTNSLLSAQVEKQEESNSKKDSQQMPGAPSAQKERPDDGEVSGDITYVEKVGFSVDVFVILKMLVIGIVLSLVSGFTSILFILRYDPKQILANRD